MPESAITADGVVQSADGTKLQYRAWPNPGSTVTLAVVHGLSDHSGRYTNFANGMTKHGLATFAVDLRGHGKSPGRRGHVDSWSQWTDDVSAFVHYVESVTGGEVVPVGHSFGGAALLSTVLSGKLPQTRRFVVSSPALKLKFAAPAWKVRLGVLASKVVPKLSMSDEVDPGGISRMPDVVAAYRADPLVHGKISSRMFTEWQAATSDILARADQIEMPFLILAGTADPIIDPEGSRLLHQKSAAMSDLHLLEGGYHEPFNDQDSDEVFALIGGWLARL
ncbi:MAG: lysophospholipase [Candidatus Dormiibacterota bacterium]